MILLNRIGLGIDDVIFIILLIIGIKIIRYWLVKVYSRIRQIAKILEYNCIDKRKIMKKIIKIKK